MYIKECCTDVSPKQSELLQKLGFNQGLTWASGKKRIKETNSNNLAIVYRGNRYYFQINYSVKIVDLKTFLKQLLICANYNKRILK